MSDAATKSRPRGFRQAMAPLHTWAGLLFGWLLFAVFLTGTVSYFRDEISLWMKPEIPVGANIAPEIAASTAIHQLQQTGMDARRWMIDLPTDRMPVTTALVMRSPRHGTPFTRLTLDAATGAPLNVRATLGGDFLYYFHFDLYMPWKLGRYLVVTASIAMLVAFISGVIVHRRIFKDFFTFRPDKGQRSWLDGHNVLGVLALPFHVMITYTGLVTLLPLYLPFGITALYPNQPQTFVAELFDETPPRKPVAIAATLIPIGPLMEDAAKNWDGGAAGRLVIDNPGDRAATIRIIRCDRERITHAVQSVTYDGISGARLSQTGELGPAAATRGILHGLHLARFSDPVLRWLFFFSGLVGSAMIATGLILWAVKRRRDSAGSRGHRIVDVLNIATLCGLPIAIAAFFIANRLLPSLMPGRGIWEVTTFFLVWLAAGIHAAVRSRQSAWIEHCWMAAIMFAAIPAVNAVTTDRSLFRSLIEGDNVYIGFDLTMLASAAGFALAGSYISTQRRRAP